MSNMFRLIFGAGLLYFLAACAGSGAPKALPDSVNQPEPTSEYRIGVEDQVQVNVWGNPDLSVSVPVRPDGKISMPLIGDVQAGGLTPEEVAALITNQLSEFIREPNVTVLLTSLRSHSYISRIRVTGAVGRQLSIPYRQGMTVLDAVLEAGGVSEFAAPNKTKLHRKIDNETKSYVIPLQDVFEGVDMRSNVELRPGDIISVPERLF